MKQLADGVWQLSGFPPNAINVFVIEDVLIDASTRYATRRILRQVKGHRISAHALTHAHPDHQGASHNVCERLGDPVLGRRGRRRRRRAPGADRRAPARPLHGAALLQDLHRPRAPGRPQARRGRRGRRLRGPARARPLRRPRRLLARVRRRPVAGDVFNTADPFTGIPGLRDARGLLHPGPGGEPPLGQAARRARAEARARRPRPARTATRASSSTSARRCRTTRLLARARPRPPRARVALARRSTPASGGSRRGSSPSAGRKSSAIPRAYTGHICSSISRPRR